MILYIITMNRGARYAYCRLPWGLFFFFFFRSKVLGIHVLFAQDNLDADVQSLYWHQQAPGLEEAALWNTQVYSYLPQFHPSLTASLVFSMMVRSGVYCQILQLWVDMARQDSTLPLNCPLCEYRATRLSALSTHICSTRLRVCACFRCRLRRRLREIAQRGVSEARTEMTGGGPGTELETSPSSSPSTSTPSETL